MHDHNHLGTYPSGLYREVVLLQGGLFRQVKLYNYVHLHVHVVRGWVTCTCSERLGYMYM